MSKFTLQRLSLNDIECEPSMFWHNLYLNYLSPQPECNICKNIINKPNEWVSFRCDCQIYYHKACLYKHFDEIECKSCKKNKEIYSISKFLNKFLTNEQFQVIYQRSIINLDPKTQLQLYNKWFHTSYIYPPPLLDLYTYLEPHDPTQTAEFLASRSHTHFIESFDPAIKIDKSARNENTSQVTIQYDRQISALYNNKKIFVDIESFKQKFKELSYDLIGDDFPWSDIVTLGGGTMHKCLESRVNVNDIPIYSDIDIFIAHSDPKIVSRETKKVIKYFQNRLNANIYWVVNKHIMNLYVPGYNRSIQITMLRNNIANLLHKFDFSHIQYCYNGKNILTTLAGLEYASLLVSTHHGEYDDNFCFRYFKAKEMKICIALPNDRSLSHIPKIEKINYWYPTQTDSADIIKFQLGLIYCSASGQPLDQKYITQTNPARIIYKKLPKECSFNLHNSIEDEASILDSDD